jgi:hypothetical protein
VLIPHLLSNLGMGGGQGVRNPVVVDGYGSPRRLILQGFGPRPVHTGEAALFAIHSVEGGGEFAAPVYTGSASLATPGRVLSGDGGFLLEFVGDGSAVVVHAVQGEGTFEAPTYSGSASLVVGHALHGQGYSGIPGFTGLAEVAVHHALAGSGLFEAPVYSGGGLLYRPASLLQGVGSFSPPAYTGSASLIVGHALGGMGSFVGGGGHALGVVHHLLVGTGTFSAPSGPSTLREAVAYRLGQVPGLSELVDDRIYFAGLPQGVQHSQGVVTYSVASRTYGRVLAGPNRTSRARVRMSCWAGTEKKADEIADKIRRYFDGYAGMVGRVYLLMTVLENETDLPEPLGDGRPGMLYRIELDFSITHRVLGPIF